MKITTLLFVLFATSLLAEDPKPMPSTLPVPPTIGAELRAKFWRKQAEYAQAKRAAESAMTALQEALKDIQTACTAAFVPVDGPDGEPICQEKPRPKKEAEPPEKSK